MRRKGKVLIDRKIMDWRWYKKPKVCHLFLHLIFRANWEEAPFENITVKRGQTVASYATLAEETGLTEKEVRTAIKNLKRTNEVANESTTKYTVFTIKNYDRYQNWANDWANKGRTKGEPRANKGQQYKSNNTNKSKKSNNTPVSAAYDSGDPVDRVMKEHIGRTDF